MFSIPHTFASEDESYITMPALRRFAKEKRKEDLKTTVDVFIDIRLYQILTKVDVLCFIWEN